MSWSARFSKRKAGGCEDGTRFFASVVIDAIYEDGVLIGFAKITRDITERMQSRFALNESENHFRLLVGNVTDYALYMLDREGRVTRLELGWPANQGLGSMAIKSLIVFVDPSPGGAARTRYAVRLAAEHEAHLIGVFIAPAAWRRNPAAGFVTGAVAVREMVERHSLFEREAAAEAIKNFEALAGRERVTCEFRSIEDNNADELARLHSLHSDLVIVGYPSPGGLPPHGTPAVMLLATGVPFLIVPESWINDGVANRILFAWNASREARRAISDALPLMKTAQSVTVLVIDPKKNASHGEQPGADVAHYLCRHGVVATVEQRQSDGKAVADIIREFAAYDGSDLIVLGAYSHARRREFIFGGVTRSLLRNITVPTLIAH